MISLVIALVFYVVDPYLGIILAIALPSAVAMDTSGQYSYVLVSVILALGFYFVRKTSLEE